MSVHRIANPLRTAGRPAGRFGTGAPGPLQRLLAVAVEGIERRRALRQLATMDERMLRDIGLDRGSVEEAVRHGRDTRPAVLPWWGG